MPKKITNQEYIEKAISIHGKRYNYSLTEYINKLSKIIIICPIHGEFKQKPYKHLYGQGCSSCANIKLKELLRFDTEIFIKKAKEIHTDRYDYSKTKYINAKNKVIIVCDKHGDFTQLPSAHLQGNGCWQCRPEARRSNTKKFIDKSITIHGDRYDYGLVEYLNNYTKVVLVCKEHGKFKQTPSDHLRGYGCPHCKRISKGEKLIYRILKENNISFSREYMIPGAVPRFRYDFYLPDLNIFIEFHGQQHYFPIEYFGGEEGLFRTKERDLFKKDLARMVNVKIIYLNYKHLKLPKEKFEKILLKKIRT